VKNYLKRYIWESGLDVIAPLKCGTRWLEELDVDNRIHHSDIYIDFDYTSGVHPLHLKENIHIGTTFIWRPVREHFLSAIKSELHLYPEKSILDIVIEIQSGTCDHWYPYLYKKLYPIWSSTPFRFHKLRALSLLNPSPEKSKWNSTMYDNHLLTKTNWDSVESALSSLSPKHTLRLERLISEEEKWLKLMIESQYSEKDWKEYSDLEDSYLKMKCEVMDMENEIELINFNNTNRLEFQRLGNLDRMSKLYSKIRELEKSNTKLKAELEYAKSLLGKKVIKLI